MVSISNKPSSKLKSYQLDGGGTGGSGYWLHDPKSFYCNIEHLLEHPIYTDPKFMLRCMELQLISLKVVSGNYFSFFDKAI